MLVHIIADYGVGDLAFAEVVQRIKFYLPDAEPVLTPVPPFSTLAAGFCIAQLGLNEAPGGTLVYHNVAPREDDEDSRRANAGEALAFARLHTGVRVIGVNAGYTFSFLRDVVEPYLRIFRGILPSFGGFDFSPIIAIIALQIFNVIVVQTLIHG